MKKSTTMATMLLCTFFLFLGCEKDKDTYTVDINNPYNFAIELGGGGHDLLSNQPEYPVILEAKESRTFTGTIYDSGNHLTHLSAIRAGSRDEDGSATLLGEGSAAFFPESEKHYAWTAGEKDVREVAAGGGGGAGCSINNYNGPDFDIQIDGQCKTAFLYKCAGNDAGVKAACDIYKQWQQHQSGIPNCPYCN